MFLLLLLCVVVVVVDAVVVLVSCAALSFGNAAGCPHTEAAACRHPHGHGLAQTLFQTQKLKPYTHKKWL